MNKHLKNGVIKSEPKKWTESEIEKLLRLKGAGISFQDIGKTLKRTPYSCNRKYYKLMKKQDTYNNAHRTIKYDYNLKYLVSVNAETLLDAYSGGVSWWEKNTPLSVVSNDNKVEGADFKMDAINFLHQNRTKNYDIVDLDPFGSAFECFDYALQIAQKGLIITFGEIVGRRFNRMDFVEHRYGMKYIDEFTPKKLSEYIEKRGLIFKKKLTPIFITEMTNITRIYYSIEVIKYGNSGCKYFPKKEVPNLFTDTTQNDKL
jgi:hypothetical protein